LAPANPGRSQLHCRVEDEMIGEGEPLRVPDAPSKLAEAREAVQTAAESVKATTQSVAAAIDASRRAWRSTRSLGELGQRGGLARGNGRVPDRRSGRSPKVNSQAGTVALRT